MKMKTVNLSKETIKDIVEWDVSNWWRGISFWEHSGHFDDMAGKKVLDIGGRRGGLSLYWALKGADVVCSDINEDGFERAQQLHKKHGVEKHIKYEKIDATDIPYQNAFDVICFKSVLGGVGLHNNYGRQQKMMENIYKALKEDGILCFAENLTATPFHQYARKKMTYWGGVWRYVTVAEIEELTDMFFSTERKTFGFLGVFGRINWLSKAFGAVDRCFDRFLKEEHRYIASCVCCKRE